MLKSALNDKNKILSTTALMVYVFLLKNYGSNKAKYKTIDLDLNKVFDKFVANIKVRMLVIGK